MASAGLTDTPRNLGEADARGDAKITRLADGGGLSSRPSAESERPRWNSHRDRRRHTCAPGVSVVGSAGRPRRQFEAAFPGPGLHHGLPKPPRASSTVQLFGFASGGSRSRSSAWRSGHRRPSLIIRRRDSLSAASSASASRVPRLKDGGWNCLRAGCPLPFPSGVRPAAVPGEASPRDSAPGSGRSSAGGARSPRLRFTQSRRPSA